MTDDPWLVTLPGAARSLPPECFAAALEPWPLAEPGPGDWQRRGWAQQIEQFSEVIRIRLIAPIDGNASPRKPSEAMRSKSSSGNFEVQCRSTAKTSSCAVMPPPLSVTLPKKVVLKP